MTPFAGILSFALVLGTTTAHASLQTVSSNPLVLTDNVTGLMWTQDANLARTNTFGVAGITSDGRMNWATAQAWVTAMNDAKYGGYDDWRLPTVSPQNGTSFNYAYSTNGTTDLGYNVSGQASELGYMYYKNMGGKGYYDTSGNVLSDYGVFQNGDSGWDQSGNIGLVNNMQSSAYWSDTEGELSSSAWVFNTSIGGQFYDPPLFQFYAWAVRSGGDIATAEIGEPASATLAFLGLGLVAMGKRRRRLGAS